MLKQYKKLLIITSIIMLLPIIIGLFLWDRLPEQIPIHWNLQGNVDGWGGKGVVVFGLPALLIAIHWVCVIASTADPKHKNYHPKAISLVLWICPVVGLCLSSITYATAMGYELQQFKIAAPLLMGIMLIATGNIMPKCRQSFTLGIRTPWTLSSEENWNKTHRFGGKVWVGAGVLILLLAFLNILWIPLVLLFAATLAPVLYSYFYYRKHPAADSPNEEGGNYGNKK